MRKARQGSLKNPLQNTVLYSPLKTSAFTFQTSCLQLDCDLSLAGRLRPCSMHELEETGKVKEFTMGPRRNVNVGSLTWNYIHHNPCMHLSVDLLYLTLSYVHSTNWIFQVEQTPVVKHVWNRNRVRLNENGKNRSNPSTIHAGFFG